MSNQKYLEKLKDPRWQKKRLEVLERDNWTCRACGDDKTTLNIHHSFYLPKKEPWEIPNGLLITLCEDCHKPDACYYERCEDCPDYHLSNDQRCYGKINPPEEIILDIANLLNFLWTKYPKRSCADIINFIGQKLNNGFPTM
jgi:hypothetical protein